MRRSGRSILATISGLLILAGCPREPHRGSTPRPTLDPGQCWPEPLTPEHSTTDGCSASSELDQSVEPNGQLASAVDDDRTGPGKTFEGSLGSGDDVDIFVVRDFPLPFTSLNPISRTEKRTKLVFTADSNSRICAFFSCATGVTSRPDVHGCDDGDAAMPDSGVSVGDAGVDGGPAAAVFPSHLQEGMLGCCRVGSGSMIVGVTCDNTEPDLGGFVTVESVGDGECNQKYTVAMSIVN